MPRKSERSQEEIQAEKDAKIKELENISVADVLSETDAETKGERYYSKQCKNLYNGVRRALVLLEKKRKLKMFSNEETYHKMVAVLDNFVPNE